VTFGRGSLHAARCASLALASFLALACSPSATPVVDHASGEGTETREPSPSTTTRGPSSSATTRAPDFVTNVELTSPDESQILGYRVAVYERPSEELAPRADDRGEGYDAALLFGARVVRDEANVAIGVSGSGTTPTHAPRMAAPLDAWVFDDGRYVETVPLDARAHEWPAGRVVIAVRRDARTPRLGAGWSIAIEP
jgi:hypothetical protein